MQVNCSNCKRVYDSKIENYEDHESGKCNWTNEDKKDSHYGSLSMFLYVGGLLIGMIMTMNTNNFLYIIAIAFPCLVISQLIMYRIWAKPLSQEKK